MLSYKQARDIIITAAGSFGTESVLLDNADGRVLAEDIFADRDYPPFNRSAMDGYAIRFEDWQKGIRDFNIQEVIYAGATASTELQAGAAFKIMTGAAVPPPADVVVRREDTREDARVEIMAKNLQQYQNIARKGEDLQKDSLAIRAFSYCSPQLISTLATLGKNTISVNRLPKVAVFSTGNEVKPIDAELSEVQIRNSNGPLIRSLLRSNLIAADIYQHLPDNKAEIRSALELALQKDIIILSGGVSAGDADFVPEVLEDLGVTKKFHKVAIKPGKPFWFGNIEGGPTVFALPGNPFSTFITFKLFIQPFLDKAIKNEVPPFERTYFSGFKKKKTSFDEFFPAKFSDFGRTLSPTNLNGSGDIRLGIDAGAIAIHPADVADLTSGYEIEYFRL